MIIIFLLSSEKNYTVTYKEYAAHRSIFGSISHALRWPREGDRFRRISRRQASQLPRRCDIPAAWVPHKAHAVFYCATIWLTDRPPNYRSNFVDRMIDDVVLSTPSSAPMRSMT